MGSIVIEPGFRVESGATFFAFHTSNEDTDGDGLPDWWEIAHFGNLSQGREGDPDGDGFSNYMDSTFISSGPRNPEPKSFR